MTDERMALLELAEKQADGDPVREMPAFAADRIMELEGLCCTNPVRDSSRESIVVAGGHEQTHTPRLQDQELADL